MPFLLGNIYATDCLLLPFLMMLLLLNLLLMVGSQTCLICAYGGAIVTWLFLMNYGQRLASSVFVLFLWVMRNIVKDGVLETYMGGIHLRMMLFSMKMCQDILGFLVLFPCLHQPILTVMCLRASL